MGTMRSNECDGFYYFLFRLPYNNRHGQNFSPNNKTVKTSIFDIKQWPISPTPVGVYNNIYFNTTVVLK